MFFMKKIVAPVAALMIIFFCSSWGFLVHRTVHQLAVYELPQPMQAFFFRNMDYIVKNAGRPDERRNTDSTEAPKHFVDLEMYEHGPNDRMPIHFDEAIARYTKDTLLKYGYVPYYVIIMKDRLTNAFKNQNKDSILFYANDLAHYLGDANVPLHTSANYDGQLTDQKGIHSLWESMIPEMLIDNYNLRSRHKAKYLDDPQQAVWNAIRRAAALVPDMFRLETEVSKSFTIATKYRTQMRRGKEVRSYTSEFAKAYAAALKNTINEQLIHSADLIADFWYTAWVDAGKPNLCMLVQPCVSDEEYDKLKAQKKSYKHNTLIADSMLLSRKQQQRSGD
jgi:hypothetical protein